MAMTYDKFLAQARNDWLDEQILELEKQHYAFKIQKRRLAVRPLNSDPAAGTVFTQKDRDTGSLRLTSQMNALEAEKAEIVAARGGQTPAP